MTSPGGGWQNPVVGGVALRIPAIQSPNFASGVSGWQINQNGTAQFNQLTLIVQTSGAAVLIYAGAAGPGTLIGSWANAAGTDAFGNAYPAGLYAAAGSLSGLSISSSALVACTITQALINGPTITQAAMTGGTMTETAITFDSTGGRLLVYATSTTTVTLTSGTSWTAPAGNYTSGKVECWGADAGGGGGFSAGGGEAGGGAAYSCEPAYPLVPGNSYGTVIGQGGTGGTTNVAGNSGGQTSFDGQGVVANGGQAGTGGVGGLGGAASGNTISHPGGNGGSVVSGTASAGGGGRAGSTGAGGNGGNGGSSPGAAGAAGTGTGGVAGGAGVAANTNGNNGGGGSGAGAASGSTQGSKQYRLSASASYYGTDAQGNGNPGGQRNTGTMFQGGETASGGGFNGTQQSMGIISGTPQSDLAGVTIDSVSLRLEMLGSWYNWGGYVYLGYTNNTSLPSNYTGAGGNFLGTYAESGQFSIDLTGTGFGAALQSGAARAIILGPGNGSFNLAYYLYCYGAGGDNAQNPLITVNYHTGTAPKQAGAGANGVIKITYSSSTTLVAAIAPAAGSDSAGNAYAAGYTGPVTAFQPGSSPAVVETWHALPLATGWTNRGGNYVAAQYRLMPDNTVMIVGSILHASMTTGTSVAVSTALPAAYIPAHDFDWAVAVTSSTPYTAISGDTGQPTLELSNTGILTLYNYPSATTGIAFSVSYSLNA